MGKIVDSIINVALLLLFPLFFVVLEVIMRLLLDLSIGCVLGLLLASAGVGSLLPYIYIENLMMHKVLEFKVEHSFANGTITTSRTTEMNSTPGKIESIKKLTLLVFLGCLIIWLCTLILAITDTEGTKIVLRISLGVITSLIAIAFHKFV